MASDPTTTAPCPCPGASSTCHCAWYEVTALGAGRYLAGATRAQGDRFEVDSRAVSSLVTRGDLVAVEGPASVEGPAEAPDPEPQPEEEEGEEAGQEDPS